MEGPRNAGTIGAGEPAAGPPDESGEGRQCRRYSTSCIGVGTKRKPSPCLAKLPMPGHAM
jgi:hypothetical protein